MSLHVFVRFEPRSGNEQQLRDELTGILTPTRTETGCIAIQLYESTRDPFTLIIHSRWVDEAAFDAHAEMPHMKRFLGRVPKLITHSVEAVRTRPIG